MAKVITITSQNGQTIYYPKTVAQQVYDDADGITVKTKLDNLQTNKQDTLVSGTNIKTVNSASLLGSGNISIPKGDPGEDAYQPFKGWYDTSSSLSTAFPTPQVGDFAYVKGATSTDPVAIYACAIAGTWADSGSEFNPANNQEFGSGEALNVTNIVDGLTSTNAHDILSAKQGKVLDQKVAALGLEIGDSGVSSKTVNYADITMALGAVTASTGADASSSNFYRTSFINIEGYEKVSFIAYKAYSSGHSFGCAFYSSDDVSTFISGSIVSIDTSLTTYEIAEYTKNIPSGAKYIRCTVYKDFRTQFKLVASTGTALSDRMATAESDISILNGSFPILRQDVDNVSLLIKGSLSLNYTLKAAHGTSAIVTNLVLQAGVKYTIAVEVSSAQSSPISIVLGHTTVTQISAGSTSNTGTYTSQSNQTLALTTDYYATPTSNTVVSFVITADKILSDEVNSNTTAITTLDAQLNGEKTTLKYTGGQWKEYTFEKGKTYFITNQGSSTVTFSLWASTSDESSIQSTNISAGATKEVVALDNANYLKAGAATTALVRISESLSNDVVVLQSDVEDLKAKTSPFKATSMPIAKGLTKSIYYDFNSGGVYEVRIQTTATGRQLKLYVGATSYYTWSQFDGDKTVRFCAWEDISRIQINFSSLFDDGTATITITRISEQLTGNDFQFGVGISCRYHVPDQNAFVIPTSENRPSGFYALFDALVTNYPTYVTKVDCDSLANDAGIETPSYMDGCPIYMYKFLPAFTPNTSSGEATSRSVLKVMIVGGTHPEYTAIMDLWRTMAIICENWATDPNLEALRWDVELYVLPCEGAYVVKTGQRTNYNGVDLNRNMPTGNWKKSGSGTTQFSGDSAGSEYESKVLIAVVDEVKPHILIDHHNANSSIGKNMVYVTSLMQKGVDIGAAHISAMTARWKARYPSIMPQDDTIFGFTQFTSEAGTRAGWACEQGMLGFTYESNEQIHYESGSNTVKVATIATDGFLNFLLRVCKTYSEMSR